MCTERTWPITCLESLGNSKLCNVISRLAITDCKGHCGSVNDAPPASTDREKRWCVNGLLFSLSKFVYFRQGCVKCVCQPRFYYVAVQGRVLQEDTHCWPEKTKCPRQLSRAAARFARGDRGTRFFKGPDLLQRTRPLSIGSSKRLASGRSGRWESRNHMTASRKSRRRTAPLYLEQIAAIPGDAKAPQASAEPETSTSRLWGDFNFGEDVVNVEFVSTFDGKSIQYNIRTTGKRQGRMLESC